MPMVFSKDKMEREFKAGEITIKMCSMSMNERFKIRSDARENGIKDFEIIADMILMSMIREITGVVDENGKPAELTEDLKLAVLQHFKEGAPEEMNKMIMFGQGALGNLKAG